MELILSEGQYNLVYNAFSFVFAAMLAGFLFFILSRTRVSPKYRMALTVSTLVVAIAGYHYLRIFDSWVAAFELVDGQYLSNGTFNEGYRYVDWLLTVPLLLAELVLVMGLARAARVNMIIKLGVAASLMIILGYPGEIATDTATKWAWWIAAMIPFVYILYVLFVELGSAIRSMSPRVAGLVNGARWLLLISWSFYPVAYLLPLTGLDAATAEVARQVGYSIADVIAKPVFGLVIYFIARAKSEEEGYLLPGDVENDDVLEAA
ncbi:MAG: bacteriorhodopsin-like [Acidimicrobiia bacterium]|nr:bacteriorhodopsin-like [Acidimicrobiia bacterium]